MVNYTETSIADLIGQILGTGINAAGSAAPVSAPVAEAQMDAMRRAYRDTGRAPTEADFLELHATGTLFAQCPFLHSGEHLQVLLLVIRRRQTGSGRFSHETTNY